MDCSTWLKRTLIGLVAATWSRWTSSAHYATWLCFRGVFAGLKQ